MARWLFPISLMLIFLATRLTALDVLPLHNDEGLHLTRAVEVWNGHPFWAISDGKIINHWPIALLNPMADPVYAGRLPTILVGLLGLAAAYSLAVRWTGPAGGALAAGLWIGSPYLFFFERLAQSDAQAGALVVVAAWAAARLVARGDWRWAVFTGVAFAAALLFRFTAAPYVLAVAGLILFLPGQPEHVVSVRLRWLAIAGVTAFVCCLPPLLYLLLRGGDFFGIALARIGAGGSGAPSLVGNLARLWNQITGYGTPTWALVTGAGLALLLAVALRGRRRLRRPSAVLLLSAVLPLAVILLLGREVLARHFVAALPLLFTAAGIGLGAGLLRIGDGRARAMATGFGLVALLFGAAPFWLTAYDDPAALPLPAEVRYENITSPSAGYGLREAVDRLSSAMTRPELPIIASMNGDSCRRANFYARCIQLTCTDAPGLPAIEAALAEYGAVYVLSDTAPLVGIDPQTLPDRATRVAAYPRPGENEAEASVVLWLVERP